MDFVTLTANSRVAIESVSDRAGAIARVFIYLACTAAAGRLHTLISYAHGITQSLVTCVTAGTPSVSYPSVARVPVIRCSAGIRIFTCAFLNTRRSIIVIGRTCRAANTVRLIAIVVAVDYRGSTYNSWRNNRRSAKATCPTAVAGASSVRTPIVRASADAGSGSCTIVAATASIRAGCARSTCACNYCSASGTAVSAVARARPVRTPTIRTCSCIARRISCTVAITA